MATVSLNPLNELYFHGRITREDAEELLRDGPNGKYLLRSREVFNTGLDIFIISVAFDGQVLHYSVDRRPDGSYNIPGGKQFIGPVEIVRHHMNNQDGIKILLSQPVSRPPDLGAVVYWGLTTDIIEAELFQAGGFSREAAREEVLRIFANSPSNKPQKFREFLRQMQYSRPWYHGVAGREEAEKRLAALGMRSGTFLVRHKKDCFVLSVIHDKQFKHYLIRERQTSRNSPGPSSPTANSSHGGGGYGMDGGPLYASLIELIHWYHAYPDGLPCSLVYPCPNTLNNDDSPSHHVEKPRSPSKIEPRKQISTVEDSLPSSRSQRSSSKVASRQSDQDVDKGPEGDIAKKLANELEIAEKKSESSKIGVVSIQRPAVAVRPTPAIPMCRPSTLPIPNEKDVTLISQKEKADAEKPSPVSSKSTSVKRVIRLPQSLARKNATSKVDRDQRSSSPLKRVNSPTPATATTTTTKNGHLKTTLIFDTVQTRVSSESSNGPKDEWDEPASGGDTPVNGVNGSGSKQTNGNFHGHAAWPQQQQQMSGLFIKKTPPKEPAVPMPDPMRIDPDNLEIHQTIGHGHFASVLFGYLVTPQSRIPVAIKSMHEKEARCLENVIKEAETMSNLTHPHIITFFGMCELNAMLLVMEYAPLGTLQKFVRSNKSFPMIRIVKLMIQVADAMRYLEKNKLVHRDLACRNVLLLSEDQAKVSDFGMSRALDLQHDYYKSQHVGKWPLKWYPPEAIYYWKFDSKTDVWSYGVTLWEATSYGSRPYQGMDGWQVLKFIENGQRLDRPPACPPQVYCLMNECWKFKSSERPTFEEVLVTMLDIDCQLAANVASD